MHSTRNNFEFDVRRIGKARVRDVVRKPFADSVGRLRERNRSAIFLTKKWKYGR
jgi:hypothetical protein